MLKNEQTDQINLFQWIGNYHPEIASDIYHFANERKCSIQYGALLKRLGVRKGVADIFLAIPKHQKSGLWIELKAGSNRPSKEQVQFLDRQVKNNYAAACCWGFYAAKAVILHYLSNCKECNQFDSVVYQKLV